MTPDIRALFPGASEQTYLDVAARGLTPSPVADVVREYLDACVHGSLDKDALRDRVDETRARFAEMIGAEPDEVAITKNTSEGLNAIAAALPWEMGDNVVLCPDVEHPNNVFLWYNLERFGVDVRSVPAVDGRIDASRMAEAMDERTRVVTFPTVSFAPGLRTDVVRLVEAARAVGAVTVADAAQSVGAERTDVRKLGVDALAAASQKCLVALYGTGFLYVRRDLAESLTPVYLARYGVDLGDAADSEHRPGPPRLRPGARRFDVGNYNYLGSEAVRRSLTLLREIGVAEIESHVRSLAEQLARGLDRLGLRVVGGVDATDRSHIVVVGPPDVSAREGAEDEVVTALHEHLLRKGVRQSSRAGRIRFSVGLYNDEGDVARALDASAEWVRSVG